MQNVSYSLSNQGIPALVVSSEPPPAAGKKAKCVVFATVPAAVSSKLSAAEWCQAAVTPFGGKAGGKPDKAQGGHEALDKASESAECAKKFAAEKLK